MSPAEVVSIDRGGRVGWSRRSVNGQSVRVEDEWQLVRNALRRLGFAAVSVVELPRGSVTFLFTDVEGTTKVFRHFEGCYPEILWTHRHLLEDAIRIGCE